MNLSQLRLLGSHQAIHTILQDLTNHEHSGFLPNLRILVVDCSVVPEENIWDYVAGFVNARSIAKEARRVDVLDKVVFLKARQGYIPDPFPRVGEILVQLAQESIAFKEIWESEMWGKQPTWTRADC